MKRPAYAPTTASSSPSRNRCKTRSRSPTVTRTHRTRPEGKMIRPREAKLFTRIFRYPKVLQEHLRNLRQSDSAVAERRLWRFRERPPDLFEQHWHRPQGINESHHRHL